MRSERAGSGWGSLFRVGLSPLVTKGSMASVHLPLGEKVVLGGMGAGGWTVTRSSSC